MEARKCDRCGQFYIKPITATITIIDKTNANHLYLKEWRENSSHDKTIDLCAECKHDLDEWFDKFKKEESKKEDE